MNLGGQGDEEDQRGYGRNEESTVVAAVVDGHRYAREHAEDRIEAPQQLPPGDHDRLGGPAEDRRRADGRRHAFGVPNIESVFQDGCEVAHRTHGHVAKVPHPIAETDGEPVVAGTVQGYQQQHTQGHA